MLFDLLESAKRLSVTLSFLEPMRIQESANLVAPVMFTQEKQRLTNQSLIRSENVIFESTFINQLY